MKNQKKLLLLLTFFFLAFSFNLSAQYRVGVKVAPGLGFLKSRNLKHMYQEIESDYSGPGSIDINTSSRLRSHFSFGAFGDYKLKENIFLMAEPMFTLSSNKIVINSRIDNVNEKGNGTVTTISSDARIKAAYFSLPLSGKYKFNKKDLYAFGGFTINFHFTPRLVSKEEMVTVQYLQDTSFTYPKVNEDHRVKLKGYHAVNLNFHLGAGKVFNPYGRNILIDIRYSLPITRSPLFGTGSGPDGLLQNAAFTEDDKNAYKEAYPRYPLKDFRMGVLSLSVAVALYKNYR